MVLLISLCLHGGSRITLFRFTTSARCSHTFAAPLSHRLVFFFVYTLIQSLSTSDQPLLVQSSRFYHACYQPHHFDANLSVQRQRFSPFHEPHECCPCSYLCFDFSIMYPTLKPLTNPNSLSSSLFYSIWCSEHDARESQAQPTERTPRNETPITQRQARR